MHLAQSEFKCLKQKSSAEKVEKKQRSTFLWYHCKPTTNFKKDEMPPASLQILQFWSELMSRLNHRILRHYFPTIGQYFNALYQEVTSYQAQKK